MPLIVLQPVDTYLGQRLRLKRRDQGLSQQALAVRIAMSAQQIEKYESGANRISASRLFEIAQALSTPVAWFFEGAPKNLDYVPPDQVDEAATFLKSPDAFEVVRIWPGLSHQRRQELLRLMRSMEWSPIG